MTAESGDTVERRGHCLCGNGQKTPGRAGGKTGSEVSAASVGP